MKKSTTILTTVIIVFVVFAVAGLLLARILWNGYGNRYLYEMMTPILGKHDITVNNLNCEMSPLSRTGFCFFEDYNGTSGKIIKKLGLIPADVENSGYELQTISAEGQTSLIYESECLRSTKFQNKDITETFSNSKETYEYIKYNFNYFHLFRNTKTDEICIEVGTSP